MTQLNQISSFNHICGYTLNLRLSIDRDFKKINKQGKVILPMLRVNKHQHMLNPSLK